MDDIQIRTKAVELAVESLKNTKSDGYENDDRNNIIGRAKEIENYIKSDTAKDVGVVKKKEER
mgnify:CR=1 FL=1